MTGRAVIHDTKMTKCRRNKAGDLVANAAVFIGRYMVRRRRLAFGNDAIVARSTVIHDALVIKFGTGKGCSVMANGAIFVSGKMTAILDGRICGSTVVA